MIKIVNEATKNLIPALNIGVKESSPTLMASHVEPQSKQRKLNNKNIFTLSLIIDGFHRNNSKRPTGMKPISTVRVKQVFHFVAA